MFSKDITDSDAFQDLPLSSQCLYFHLGMAADDEGFINSPKRIQRMVGAAANDYDLLIAKRFVLEFESGVVVIKHWQMNNAIRKDRIKTTKYLTEKETLVIKENGAYTTNFNQMSTSCQPNVRIGKDSIVEDSIVEDSIDKTKPKPKPKSKAQIFAEELDELFKANNIFSPVKESILEFIEHRKLIKKPMNILAVKKFINKLLKEATSPVIQIELMDDAIANGWQTIYPKKNNNNGYSKNDSFEDYR